MSAATIADQLREQMPTSTDPARLARLAHEAEGGTWPARLQRRRVKGYRLPPATLCVTRPSRWGNPYQVGKRTMHVASGRWVTPKDLAHCVELYRESILFYLREYPDMLEPLRGRNLACYCAPGSPCHGDVLILLANRPKP